jgi:uncharacterized damage-inducible protein DinB
MRKTRPFGAGWGLVANRKFYPKQCRKDFARIACVTDLNAAVARDFARYYQEAAQKVRALVEPLSDEQIWARPYPYGNSIGHLLLHLTGNLSYYIGAEIAGTGYVRNRPLEFTDTSRHPKGYLLKHFDAAMATVTAALQKQAEQDWPAAYSAKGLEDAGDRFTVFLRCAAHISHHTGQIIYLCKESERAAEVI